MYCASVVQYWFNLVLFAKIYNYVESASYNASRFHSVLCILQNTHYFGELKKTSAFKIKMADIKKLKTVRNNNLRLSLAIASCNINIMYLVRKQGCQEYTLTCQNYTSRNEPYFAPSLESSVFNKMTFAIIVNIIVKVTVPLVICNLLECLLIFIIFRDLFFPPILLLRSPIQSVDFVNFYYCYYYCHYYWSSSYLHVSFSLYCI